MLVHTRLARGQIDRKHIVEYTCKARRALIHEIGAEAWSLGIPWAEAIPIAEKAISRGYPKRKLGQRPERSGKQRAKRNQRPGQRTQASSDFFKFDQKY